MRAGGVRDKLLYLEAAGESLVWGQGQLAQDRPYGPWATQRFFES